MAENGPILVTGAAGQLVAVGRTVTGLLLDRGLPVRAMVRREDDRAAALRAAGAVVVVGDLVLRRTPMMQPGSMLAPIALAFALFACSGGSGTSGPPSATQSQAETTPPPTSVVPEAAPADDPAPDPGKVPTGGSPDRTRFRFDLNVGVAWVGRDNKICMTLKNAAAGVGQRVALATPNWPGTRKVLILVVAEVKDVKSESCKADEPYPDPDDVLYELSAVTREVHRDDGVFVAVLDPPPIMFVGESGVMGDLDGNGTSEIFFSCSSNEGIHYSVWSVKRESGARRWHYYRYIGMEIEADCDGLDYEDLPT